MSIAHKLKALKLKIYYHTSSISLRIITVFCLPAVTFMASMALSLIIITISKNKLSTIALGYRLAAYGITFGMAIPLVIMILEYLSKMHDILSTCTILLKSKIATIFAYILISFILTIFCDNIIYFYFTISVSICLLFSSYSYIFFLFSIQASFKEDRHELIEATIFKIITNAKDRSLQEDLIKDYLYHKTQEGCNAATAKDIAKLSDTLAELVEITQVYFGIRGTCTRLNLSLDESANYDVNEGVANSIINIIRGIETHGINGELYNKISISTQPLIKLLRDNQKPQLANRLCTARRRARRKLAINSHKK